jgi:hypothetical protein
MYLFLQGVGLTELIILIPLMGLIVYSLMDVSKREFSNPTSKYVWMALIIFAPVLGCLVYLILGKPPKNA